jgi:HK97 family phage major capsid protein
MELPTFTAAQLHRSRLKDFSRMLAARYEASRTPGESFPAVFARRWPRSLSLDSLRTKAAMPAGATTTWGSSLVPPEVIAAFAEYVHPFTILGRIPGLRRVPFNTSAVRTTTAMSFGWVGEGAPKPLRQMAFAAVPVTFAKAVGMFAMSEELVLLRAPGSEDFLNDELRRGIVAWLDGALVDPTIAAVPDVSPASLTNGVTPIAASGTTAAAAVADLASLLTEYVFRGGHIETAVVLLSSKNAIGLRLTGNSAFEGLTREGGTLAGLPAVASDALNDQIVVLDTAMFFAAFDDAIDISTARNTTLQMLDNPTNNAATATATQMVSMWQTNTVAVRVERPINWVTLAGAVAVLDGANYMGVGSP